MWQWAKSIKFYTSLKNLVTKVVLKRFISIYNIKIILINIIKYQFYLLKVLASRSFFWFFSLFSAFFYFFLGITSTKLLLSLPLSSSSKINANHTNDLIFVVAYLFLFLRLMDSIIIPRLAIMSNHGLVSKSF